MIHQSDEERGESMAAGGMEGETGMSAGDGSARLVSFHLTTSSSPRGPGAPGLKNRPSRK
jgi:hypothetical protein